MSSGLADLPSNVHTSLDDDTENWYSVVVRQLNSYAPLKYKRVKNVRLPEWMTPDITAARQQRDYYKRIRDWRNYKKFRNETKKLISTSKRQFFMEAINNGKNTTFLWKHLKNVNCSKGMRNSVPDELVFDGHSVTDAREIAQKLNMYFTSISKLFYCTKFQYPDISKLHEFVDEQVPDSVYFRIPVISTHEVFYILT